MAGTGRARHGKNEARAFFCRPVVISCWKWKPWVSFFLQASCEQFTWFAWILSGMFSAWRCVHRKVRLTLRPQDAVWKVFFEARGNRQVLWWTKMLSFPFPTTENSIFSKNNAAIFYFFFPSSEKSNLSAGTVSDVLPQKQLINSYSMRLSRFSDNKLWKLPICHMAGDKSGLLQPLRREKGTEMAIQLRGA